VGASSSADARQVQELVTAIEALPDLTRPRIEQLLGVSLQPAGEGRNQAATLPSGPFQRVVLHEPSSTQPTDPWRLGLEVREGVKLPLRAFEADFLGPIVDINPDIPPEGTVARGIVTPGRSRLLEFWAGSGTLRQASFRRDQAAPPGRCDL
jgi:hypothetical protein